MEKKEEDGIAMVFSKLTIVVLLILIVFIIAIVVWFYQKSSKIEKFYAKVDLSKRNHWKRCLLAIISLAILLVFGYQIGIAIPETKTDIPVKAAGTVQKPKTGSYEEGENKNYKNVLKKLYGVIKKEYNNYCNDQEMASFHDWTMLYDDSQLQVFSAEDYLMGDVPAHLQETLNETKFYKIIKTKDSDLCEAYHTLPKTKKKQLQNLSWREKKGILYAVEGEEVLAGTAQMSLADSSLMKRLEQAGFHGICSWMRSCDRKKNSIEVSVGKKIKPFYDTDQMYTFESQGVCFYYNHKIFSMKASRQKMEEKKDIYTKLPQEGIAQWQLANINTGGMYDQVNFMKYVWDNAYYKKNIKLMLKNDQIIYMSIAADFFSETYNEEAENAIVAVKTGFYKKEQPFIRGCLLKMGAAENEANQWISKFSFKQKKKEGNIGKLSYRIEQANVDQRIKYRVVISKN